MKDVTVDLDRMRQSIGLAAKNSPVIAVGLLEKLATTKQPVLRY